MNSFFFFFVSRSHFGELPILNSRMDFVLQLEINSTWRDPTNGPKTPTCFPIEPKLYPAWNSSRIALSIDLSPIDLPIWRMWLLVPAILLLMYLGQCIGQCGAHLLTGTAILALILILIVGRQGIIVEGGTLADGIVLALLD